MANPKELDARAAELDRREAQLNTLRDELTEQARVDEQSREALVERDAAITAREDALKDGRGTTLRQGDELAEHGATYSVLPEPRNGFGFIVVEAPCDLVGAVATLHPAEMQSVAAQAAGAIRQVLAETGKYRGRTSVDSEAVTLAVLASADEVSV